MERIETGKYVELGYDLYAVEADGREQLVHQTDKSDPEKIIFGVTRGMIAPLEKAIEGLEVGGKFNVTATADEAFGPYDPEQVVSLERDLFVVDGSRSRQGERGASADGGRPRHPHRHDYPRQRCASAHGGGNIGAGVSGSAGFTR